MKIANEPLIDLQTSQINITPHLHTCQRVSLNVISVRSGSSAVQERYY